MADAIISVVVERVSAILEEQIRNEVSLVRGVEKEILNLSDELKTMRMVLDDAEKRGYKENSIKDWLKKLEDTAYEMDDVLDEWNYAILKLKIQGNNHHSDYAVVAHAHAHAHAHPKQKVCSFIPSSSCLLCFKKVVIRRDIAKKILYVKAKLDKILEEKDRYNFVMSHPTTCDSSPKSWRVQSTSSIELDKVRGRDVDRDHTVSKLLRVNDDSLVLSIVGVGGLGETTLAQLVYNDSRVDICFDLRIWVCVSDPFDEVGIVKGIIERVAGRSSHTNTKELEMLLQYLRDCISGKKFLLVLDDVWTEECAEWEPLKSKLIKYGGEGSKILMTTRNERVAKVMGCIEKDMYHLRQLSDGECWSLLRRISLSERSEEECEKFEDIGKKIANKCKGLPLKVLASLLRSKNSLEEWENVLENEIWQLEEAEVDFFPHLLLSYNELSPELKRCFSYCAVFPKDSVIQTKTLIGIWMALGDLGSNMETMELKWWDHLQILASWSLFQEIVKVYLDDEEIVSFKMHDIVHDFANFVRKGRRRVVEEVGSVKKKKKTVSCLCSPSLIARVKAYRSL